MSEEDDDAATVVYCEERQGEDIEDATTLSSDYISALMVNFTPPPGAHVIGEDGVSVTPICPLDFP